MRRNSLQATLVTPVWQGIFALGLPLSTSSFSQRGGQCTVKLSERRPYGRGFRFRIYNHGTSTLEQRGIWRRFQELAPQNLRKIKIARCTRIISNSKSAFDMRACQGAFVNYYAAKQHVFIFRKCGAQTCFSRRIPRRTCEDVHAIV